MNLSNKPPHQHPPARPNLKMPPSKLSHVPKNHSFMQATLIAHNSMYSQEESNNAAATAATTQYFRQTGASDQTQGPAAALGFENSDKFSTQTTLPHLQSKHSSVTLRNKNNTLFNQQHLSESAVMPHLPPQQQQ